MNVQPQKSTPLLANGTRIGERYIVVRALGEGGMGQVFEVEHEAIGRHFALKLLNNTSFSDEALRRFRREVKALGRVDSVRVAQVTDFGFEPSCGPFYIMELVDGVTLEARLRAERRVALQEAIPIALDLCEALTEVHRASIIHRDLKPSNIGLTRGGSVRVKLLDFGLAAAIDGAMLERITKSQEVVGSLPYMAPERFYDAPLTLSSDLYALGVVLYEMLTGQLPYPCHSAPVLINHHLNEPPIPFDIAAPDLMIPRSLENIIIRLLDKSPTERFVSADAVGRALQAATIDAPIPTLPEGDSALSVASTMAAEDVLEGPTLAQKGYSGLAQDGVSTLAADSRGNGEPVLGSSRTGEAAGIPTSVVPAHARGGLPPSPTAAARVPFVGQPQTPIPKTVVTEGSGTNGAGVWVSGPVPKTAFPSNPPYPSSPSNPPVVVVQAPAEQQDSGPMRGFVALIAAGVIGSILAAALAIVLFKLVPTWETTESVPEETTDPMSPPSFPASSTISLPPRSKEEGQGMSIPPMHIIPPPSRSGAAPANSSSDGGASQGGDAGPERLRSVEERPKAAATKSRDRPRPVKKSLGHQPRWTGGVIYDRNP